MYQSLLAVSLLWKYPDREDNNWREQTICICQGALARVIFDGLKFFDALG